MKKKVAILTQPLDDNYGGIIQNYALQKVLKDLGYTPVTINRKSDKRPPVYMSCLISLKKHILKTLLRRNLLTEKDLAKIYKHNEEFIKKHIDRSKEIKNTKTLATYFHNQQFDAVIVGSDQTWRPKYSPNIFNFYLDFLKENHSIKKAAYASSFGTDEWEYTEEETKLCKELVQQFDAVSVREASGVRLCAHYLAVKALHLLDPAFLLSTEEYNHLIDLPEVNRGLFTYVLDESPEKIDFIKNTAAGLEMGIFRSQGQQFDPRVKRSFEEYIAPPLNEWLRGFRDADFVITDSFHGTIFSIIHKKPFLVLVNRKRGASRFESLLTQLGICDRLIYDVNEFDLNLLTQQIDYEQIHEKLNALKEESLEFIKKYI